MEIDKGSLVTNNQFYYKGKVFIVVRIESDVVYGMMLNDEVKDIYHLPVKECELFKGKITLENKILVEESLILSAKVVTAKKLRKTKDFI